MCTVCGCGHNSAINPEVSVQSEGTGGSRSFHRGQDTASRIIQIERDLLHENNQFAAMNRSYFVEHRILALNLVSSPGSGKTSLLVRTLADLRDEFPLAVIEGDQQTDYDAQRIRSTGIDVVQVNTGKGCHLDGRMIGNALNELRPQPGGVLFIENVGNLVCPALFDLGEAHKVVVLSVTEGSEKALKYPDMFHAADLMLVNKIDLLPYVEFDIEHCISCARSIKPNIEVLSLSATTGSGMSAWYEWMRRCRPAADGNRVDELSAGTRPCA